MKYLTIVLTAIPITVLLFRSCSPAAVEPKPAKASVFIVDAKEHAGLNWQGSVTILKNTKTGERFIVAQDYHAISVAQIIKEQE